MINFYILEITVLTDTSGWTFRLTLNKSTLSKKVLDAAHTKKYQFIIYELRPTVAIPPQVRNQSYVNASADMST